MGFGWSGAGAGAANALEQILAQQLLTAQAKQREQETAKRLQMDETRLNAQLADAEDDRKFRTRQEDRIAAGDRDKNNRLGVRRMIGESLMQRTGPMTPEDRRSIAAMQVEAGDLPDMSLLTEPTPKMRSVTTRGPNGQPINRMVPETESVEEYREPKEPRQGPQPGYLTLIDSNGNQRRVPDGAQANQMLEQGWKLFDAVAARSSKPTDDPEARDTAAEAKRLASELLGAKGFEGAFGLFNSRLPTMKQDTADAEAIKNALTGMLTLENMNKMKGVLSDSDMKVLRQASTTLSGPISPEAARRELKRVVDVMSRASGDSQMPKMDLVTSPRGNVPAPATDNPFYQQYLNRRKGGGQ